MSQINTSTKPSSHCSDIPRRACWCIACHLWSKWSSRVPNWACQCLNRQHGRKSATDVSDWPTSVWGEYGTNQSSLFSFPRQGPHSEPTVILLSGEIPKSRDLCQDLYSIDESWGSLVQTSSSTIQFSRCHYWCCQGAWACRSDRLFWFRGSPTISWHWPRCRGCDDCCREFCVWDSQEDDQGRMADLQTWKSCPNMGTMGSQIPSFPKVRILFDTLVMEIWELNAETVFGKWATLQRQSALKTSARQPLLWAAESPCLKSAAWGGSGKELLHRGQSANCLNSMLKAA